MTKQPNRWYCLLLLGLTLGLGFSLQVALAHEEAGEAEVMLVPACPVTTVACVPYADAHAAGEIHPFPGLPVQHFFSALDGLEVREDLQPLFNVPCQNGFADLYACHNIDLLAYLPVTYFGDSGANTLWGWTDPESGKEYAIVGLRNGTAFVDISTPTAPRYLGKLPTQTKRSNWRDMKVYQHYAYIVSDFNGAHGMQIFDLAQLRTLTTTTPVTLSAIAHYDAFTNSHNIVINEGSGFAYAVGTNVCDGGMQIIDIRNPLQPTPVGCYTEDGYVHDAQCVVYNGPDHDYTGREICINASVNKITVVDVTAKTAPTRLSVTSWEYIGYIHQGWLTPDQRYLLVDDEFDERLYKHNARTYVLDMTDLDAPRFMGAYESLVPSADHNLYISGTFAFEANYTAGLRILDLQQVDQAVLREVAWFDTTPGTDSVDFGRGAWSAYPYFASGVVIVNTIDRGLFIVKPHLPVEPFTVQKVHLPLILTK